MSALVITQKSHTMQVSGLFFFDDLAEAMATLKAALRHDVTLTTLDFQGVVAFDSALVVFLCFVRQQTVQPEACQCVHLPKGLSSLAKLYGLDLLFENPSS